MISKTCPKCGAHFKCSTGKKFCSRKCSNSRIQTEGMNQARKEELKGKSGHTKSEGRELVEREDRNCKECNSIFRATHKDPTKYCSTQCSRKNQGGYRQGSGIAKSGFYKGIYCASTYELVWVIFRLDHGLPVERFPSCLTKGDLRYFPDFLVEGTIVEIKGRYTKDVDSKTQLAESLGYKVEIKFKEDLTSEFNWVKNNYQFRELYELYDNFKPQYNYICAFCNKDFTYPYKKKTTINYCSRFCAGKGVKNRVAEKSIEEKQQIKEKARLTLLQRDPSLIHKGYKRCYKHIWINNGSIQTRIKEESAIPEGFTQGRLRKIS